MGRVSWRGCLWAVSLPFKPAPVTCPEGDERTGARLEVPSRAMHVVCIGMAGWTASCVWREGKAAAREPVQQSDITTLKAPSTH